MAIHILDNTPCITVMTISLVCQATGLCRDLFHFTIKILPVTCHPLDTDSSTSVICLAPAHQTKAILYFIVEGFE